MSDELSLKWATQVDLERDVVMACSEDPDQAVLLGELSAEDFTDPSAKAIHRAVLALARSGDCNIILVSKWLVDHGEVEAAAAYRSHLTTASGGTPTSWVRQWIRALLDASLRRKVCRATWQMAQMANDPEQTAESLQRLLPTVLTKALARATPNEAVIERISMENLAGFLAKQEASEMGLDASATHTLSTGWDTVDKGMGGGSAGEMIVLAAASSMGKSAFALQIARHWAKDGDVYLWSGEMDKNSIARRSAAQVLQEPLKGIRSSQVYEVADLHSKRLWVDDERSLTVERLAQKLAIFKLQHPDLVALVIDYLGLLAGNDYKDVSSASRRIKQLAGELGIPVLLLCQLSRKIEDRPDKKPQMSDLRDSGQIEQDADKVLMLYRPGYYDRKRDQAEATLYVRKWRDGARNSSIPLLWNGRTVSFFEGTRKKHQPDTNFIPDQIPMEEMDVF